MTSMRERPMVIEGERPTGSPQRPFGWAAWLGWILGLNWRHAFTIREAQSVGPQSLVTEYRCWHNRISGEIRYVESKYFTPPLPPQPTNPAPVEGVTVPSFGRGL